MFELYYYQLKNYKLTEYIRTINSRLKNKLYLTLKILKLFNAINLIFYLIIPLKFLIFVNCNAFLALFFINYCIFYRNFLNTPKKIPFKVTNRIKRLICIYLILNIIFILINLHLFNNLILFICTIIAFQKFVKLASIMLSKLLEHLIFVKYLKMARFKLKNSKCKVIAITGSNGKTSVKNILFTILSTKKKVITTPKNFNTPLGVTLTINNDLNPDTDILILEFGARHKKDIKTLCKLFPPDIGIITNVCSQHLQTFKSIENIAKEKEELSKSLNEKLCVYNIDNQYVRQMYDNKVGKKISISKDSKSDYSLSNIEIINNKTKFTVISKDCIYSLSTKLLGAFNAYNIALCIPIAKYFNISKTDIIKSVSKLQFTPHRLELLKTPNNFILDDSYNASPISSYESLKVLSYFSSNKIVMTPGIVETGKESKSINYNLGKHIAQIADKCIIVNEINKNSILEGLFSQNFNKNSIYYAKNLIEAKKILSSILKKGDTLLILNDLTDEYV